MVLPNGMRAHTEYDFLYAAPKIYYQYVKSKTGLAHDSDLDRRFPAVLETTQVPRNSQGKFKIESSGSHLQRSVMVEMPLKESHRDASYRSRVWRNYKNGENFPDIRDLDSRLDCLVNRVAAQVPGSLEWLCSPFWWLFEDLSFTKPGLIELARRLPAVAQNRLLIEPFHYPYLQILDAKTIEELDKFKHDFNKIEYDDVLEFTRIGGAV